jgi:hypothetical protein
VVLLDPVLRAVPLGVAVDVAVRGVVGL